MPTKHRPFCVMSKIGHKSPAQVHLAHKAKWRPINFTVNTPLFFFPDSLCEQSEGTVQYFYIIIVHFCTQNVLKELVQGMNGQIQKYMKATSFQKAVY